MNFLGYKRKLRLEMHGFTGLKGLFKNEQMYAHMGIIEKIYPHP